MSAPTPALPPLSLSLSLSPPRAERAAPSRPAIAGRLNARPSFSLTAFLSDLPSDCDRAPSSSCSASPPPSPSRRSHAPDDHIESRRRRRRRAPSSRIARPKDAMPGFRRRRHFAAAASTRRRFSAPSRAAPGGAGHFDRAVSAATYYGQLHPPAVDAAHQQGDDGDDTRADALEQWTPCLASPPPLCAVHAEPAVLLTCRKAGRNRGRQFYKCARKAHAQCDFFRWLDDAAAPPSDAECDAPQLSAPHVVAEATAVEPIGDDYDRHKLLGVLRRVFAHDQFRPPQRGAIERLLSARSTVALMPTGGGKSLIYQMFAALRPGVVLVITPLLSLMQDQMDSLPHCLPGACLRSGLTLEAQAETERRVCAGEVKILFISPERLFSKRFRRLMRAEHAPCVSLVVIDEAHCISHWSHNFRVAYLRIPQALYGARGVPAVFRERPLVLALTATATKQTLKDVCACLEVDVEEDVVRVNSGRRNLVLSLSRVRGNIDGKAYELVRRFKMQPFASILGIDKEEPIEMKLDEGENAQDGSDIEPPRKKRRSARSKHEDDLSIGWGSNLNVTKRVRAQKKLLRRKHTGSLIVYVTKQRDCEALMNYLKVSTLSLSGKIEMYHGGMAQKDRERVQTQFEKGSVAILVATVAFGMGLNFSNVRGVIHFDLPPSLEAYWQEVGRAGRQGQEAYCTVLFSSFDLNRTLSRSHSDGIDKSQIRQFLRAFLSSMFELKSISQRTRAFLNEQAKAKATSLSDIYTDADEQFDEDDDHLGHRVMRMTEFDLNRKLDMRFEMAETICAILERELSEFQLLRSTNTKAKVRFYSQTPDMLIKAPSRGIRAMDRMVVDAILKHGSRSNGQYCLDLSDAALQETQVIGCLRRLQEARHITFEVYEKGIEVECSESCFNKLQREVDKWVQFLHDKFERVEEMRVQKARAVARTFAKADDLLSDKEQSEFVHKAIEAYFEGEQRVSEFRCAGTDDDAELAAKPSAERMKQVRNAAYEVMGEQGCGARMARTGRQIARVLHGLDSAAFRAKDWYSQRNWGRFVDVPFKETKRIAGGVVREKHAQPARARAGRHTDKTG